MSEQPYTPDEFNVRMEWVTNGIGPEDDLNAEFDRFIAKVKATALSEELHQAITRHPAGKHIPPADPEPHQTPP